MFILSIHRRIENLIVGRLPSKMPFVGIRSQFSACISQSVYVLRVVNNVLVIEEQILSRG